MDEDFSNPVDEFPRWDRGVRPFLTLSSDELDASAKLHGFKRERQRNWVRRTADFMQLVNLQKSQWSSEDRYLNFALWPLAFGEPASLAESKFPFRIRAEHIAGDFPGLFIVADRLQTLADVRQAQSAGLLAHAAITKDLRQLLN